MVRETQSTHQRESIGTINIAKKFHELSEVTTEEVHYSRTVDKYIERQGYHQIQWAKCTFWMTIIFLIITMLVHFYKADFVNITICCVAIYLLTFADPDGEKYWRWMVFGIVLTLGYDLLWFWEREDDYSGDMDKEDGGVQSNVRSLSLKMAWVSFLYKILMCFVYWKSSIDYAAILDARSEFIS